MRSGIRGVLTGALALVALQTAVRPGASGRVGQLFQVPGKMAHRFISPTIPAIPDRRGSDDDEGGAGGLARGYGGRRSGSSSESYPSPWTRPAGLAGGGD